MSVKSARSYTLLSIAAATITIALKFGAYRLTGSVGLLSDALESTVNLVAALVAFWALSFAAKPADEEHPFGHTKAEYFSSGLESALIVVAAISIAIAAWDRLFNTQPIEQIGWGLENTSGRITPLLHIPCFGSGGMDSAAWSCAV